MAANTFIYVKNPDIDKSKWIENRNDVKQKAVKEGYIYQSIYEYSKIPDNATPFPLYKGDFFIFADAPEDPPMAILTLQELLRKIADAHPEVDLSMFHYYVEYDKATDTGKAFVRIPASLFGSEIPCSKLQLYHQNILDRFLSYVDQEYFLSLYSPDRTSHIKSTHFRITDFIYPYQYLSPKSPMWLSPENCSIGNGYSSLYTTEIDPAKFMKSDMADLWYDVRSGYKWRVQTQKPAGTPLEEVYLQSQYVATDNDAIEKDKQSLALCEIYKKIIANPELLTEKQIEKAIEIFVQLGKDGLNMVFDLFEGQHECTREQLYNRFLFMAYNRDKVRCSNIQECFKCPGDCGVRSPWQLEMKRQNDNHILQNYRLQEDGLYYSENGFSDEDTEPVKLCSRFEVVAKVCDIDGTGWSKLVLLEDADGNRKYIRIPLKECQGNNVFQTLLDHGLEIISLKASRKITDYFMANNPTKIIRSTNKLGWHDNTFVLPEQNIGFGKDNILFSGSGDKFQIAGNLSDWQENVGKYCEGNTLLMFLVAYALTGPLLRPMNMEGGGFHLYGPSSVGKTTQAIVAGSVWGGNENKGYLIQWRTTPNALEKIASRHNDGFMELDEIGEATSEDIYQVSYMLVNGQGKERMRADASLRNVNTWKLNFLSTGELPLAEKISETGKRSVKAGQEVRMVDLPVLTGIFENLHGCKSGAEFSHLLKTNASKYFGAPIRVFLKAFCGETPKAMNRNLDEIESIKREFIKKNCPKGSGGQVQRVVLRFALVAAAGVFACKNGILPWSPTEAESVAAKCFKVWLDERGTLGSKEIENVINKLKDHWGLYADTRYLDKYIDTPSWSCERRGGYKWRDKKTRQMVCFMLSDIFSELTRGCNRAELLHELDKRGMLLKTKEGKPKDTISLYGKTIRGTALFLSEELKERDEDYGGLKKSGKDLADFDF